MGTELNWTVIKKLETEINSAELRRQKNKTELNWTELTENPFGNSTEFNWSEKNIPGI